VALLKIDTEGADPWVIMGCGDLLASRSIKEIWFEQNHRRQQNLGIPEPAVFEFLADAGYVATAVGRTTGDVIAWAAVPKPAD
jgi:hypothetical protein